MAGSEAARGDPYISVGARAWTHNDSPLNLHMDNRSAIDVATTLSTTAHEAHAHRHFFIRECVENHKLRVTMLISSRRCFRTQVLSTAE